MLDFAGKGITVSQIYETIDITRRAGIASYGYFMIGYPTETRETIEDTIALAKSLDLDFAGFSLVTPFPGTQLYEYCKRNGLLRSDDWSEYDMIQPQRGVIRLEHVTDEELVSLYNKAQLEFAFKDMSDEVREIIMSGDSVYL